MNNCYPVKPGIQRWSLGFWWLTTILLGWHAAAFPYIRSGESSFSWSASVMRPLWLAVKSPKILLQSLGHDRVPMFFWGPFMDLGRWICFFIRLDPDGCLLADWFKVHKQLFEKPGAGNERAADSDLNFCFCKNAISILRWRGVFCWQQPFNGCQHLHHWGFSV